MVTTVLHATLSSKLPFTVARLHYCVAVIYSQAHSVYTAISHVINAIYDTVVHHVYDEPLPPIASINVVLVTSYGIPKP